MAASSSLAWLVAECLRVLLSLRSLGFESCVSKLRCLLAHCFLGLFPYLFAFFIALPLSFRDLCIAI